MAAPIIGPSCARSLANSLIRAGSWPGPQNPFSGPSRLNNWPPAGGAQATIAAMLTTDSAARATDSVGPLQRMRTGVCWLHPRVDKARRGLAFDAADSDAFDEVALEGKEHQHHRDGRHGGASHQHAVVGVELALQRGQADLDRVLEAVAQDDERQNEAVPVALKREDGQHSQRGGAQR